MLFPVPIEDELLCYKILECCHVDVVGGIIDYSYFVNAILTITLQLVAGGGPNFTQCVEDVDLSEIRDDPLLIS